MNPLVPAFIGLAAVFGGGKKRRRRKKKAEGDAAPAQRSDRSARRARVLQVQSGRYRKNDETTEEASSQATEEAAAQPVAGASERPQIRLDRRSFGVDSIGLTRKGDRGYVGPQWWATRGREMLLAIRRRNPQATPQEVTQIILSQAVPRVDWTAEELPRGARILQERVGQKVEAAYMGRDAEEAPESPPDMPFNPEPPQEVEDVEAAEDQPPPPEEPQDAPPEPETSSEDAEAAAPPVDPPPTLKAVEAPQSSDKKTRRGSRGRGKKRGSAQEKHDDATAADGRSAPEDVTGDSSPEAHAASGD